MVFKCTGHLYGYRFGTNAGDQAGISGKFKIHLLQLEMHSGAS